MNLSVIHVLNQQHSINLIEKYRYIHIPSEHIPDITKNVPYRNPLKNRGESHSYSLLCRIFCLSFCLFFHMFYFQDILQVCNHINQPYYATFNYSHIKHCLTQHCPFSLSYAFSKNQQYSFFIKLTHVSVTCWSADLASSIKLHHMFQILLTITIFSQNAAKISMNTLNKKGG